MTFLDKIFGNSKEQETRDVQSTLPEKDLFVTDETPAQPGQAEKQREGLSMLELLLRRNFEPEGFRDGYDQHDLDMLELKVQGIASEFKEAYREEIDAYQAEMQKLAQHLNGKVKEYMANQYAKLQARYDDLGLQKAELQAEMVLAESEEGRCERALRNYRYGFNNGYGLYLEETHFNINL
jgi:DNA repair ATPase RecN